MFVLVVDADGLKLLGQQIAQQLADQALFPVDDGRRPRSLGAVPDLGPDAVERLEIADDVLAWTAGGRRADDDAAGEAAGVAELADDAAQPAALVARFDLPRHADMIDGRHEHQEAAGHGDMRRDHSELFCQRAL